MNTAYGFIYITENLVNHKKYIGQRIFDTEGRWEKYLGSGLLLHRAIKKYGEENFRKEIIDTAYSQKELNEKEIFWIEFFNATTCKDYYNIAAGGTGGNTKAGYTTEEYAASEQKRILSVSKSLKKRCGEKASSSILSEIQVKEIIFQLQSGAFQTDIANKYGVSVATINDIVNHRTWRHLTNDIEFPRITRQMVGVRSSKSSSKPVVVYNKEMELIGTYPSARAVERALNVGYRLVSQVCHGDKPSAHGYIFRFAQ